MGITARDADILELIVGHLQQSQPAAPALQQMADPSCQRADQTHQTADKASLAGRTQRLAWNRGSGMADCRDCIHFLSAKTLNCTHFGARLICIDSYFGAI